MVKNIKDTRMFRMNWLSFFLAFILGIFNYKFNSPPIRNVIKYPTPYNANKIVYMNHDNQCYKYNAEEVKCTEASLTQPII